MCSCVAYKLILIGAVFVANDQSWFWSEVSPWLLLGTIMIAVGMVKVVMPVCKVHDKPQTTKKAKK
jgi:hypothetical protein